LDAPDNLLLPKPVRGLAFFSHFSRFVDRTHEPGKMRKGFDLTIYPAGGIFSGMKVKTSVTLNEEIVEALDRITGEGSNRSQMIERAVAEFIERECRQLRDLRDLEILTRSAEEVNEEIDDIFSYQVGL
jgi:Arc/MetJ-type ribon-helix-helix transcriptional regulator